MWCSLRLCWPEARHDAHRMELDGVIASAVKTFCSVHPHIFHTTENHNSLHLYHNYVSSKADEWYINQYYVHLQSVCLIGWMAYLRQVFSVCLCCVCLKCRCHQSAEDVFLNCLFFVSLRSLFSRDAWSAFGHRSCSQEIEDPNDPSLVHTEVNHPRITENLILILSPTERYSHKV